LPEFCTSHYKFLRNTLEKSIVPCDVTAFMITVKCRASVKGTDVQNDKDRLEETMAEHY